MKKFLAGCLSLALCLSLAACGGGSNSTAAPAEAPKTESSSAPAAEGGAPEAAPAENAGAGKACTITLITMDQMDVHWVKLKKAAEEEVNKYKEQGYDITFNWLAPESKDNAQQIAQIEAATNNQSDVIIIAVNDSTACNNALQAAMDAGIKIIYVDSPSTLPGAATFATDNYAAGAQAGQKMKETLEANGVTEGTIGIVSAQAGVQSCIDRVDGFLSVFEGSSYTMGEVQYSDGVSAKAQELATNLINDGVVAIYAANDGATNGTGNAVKDAAANGKTVYCVGFDNSETNRTLVKDGAVVAFMAQNPNIMGSESIKAAIELVDGKELTGEVIDTGVTVVTQENVDQFAD